MTFLLERPISEVSILMHRGEVSPVTYTEQVLQRIESANPRLRAFVHLSAQQALEDAQRAACEMQAGNVRGPLHGIPFALKDLIDHAGSPTTGNSRVLQDHVAHRDAHVTERLKQAGAIYIGKLVTNEFACGGQPVDALHPAPLNPWNPDYITAGSSSGSAVAVAAFMVPLALGTDTNGSIRNPASRCGIVGMKPTYGRVSRRGILPLAPSIDHVGPMTRSVRDNALSLQAIAGFDPQDPTSSKVAVPDYCVDIERGVKNIRIGVMGDVFRNDPATDSHHNEAFEQCLEILRAGGADLKELQLPYLSQFDATARSLLSMEGFAVHEEWLHTVPHLYGNGCKTRLLQGAFFSAADYQHAQRLRARLTEIMETLCADIDVIVTASCYDATPRVDDADAAKKRHLYQLHMPFNVTGQPALVLPMGVSRKTRMPLSIQIAGQPFGEAMIYRVARHLERILESDKLPLNSSGEQ